MPRGYLKENHIHSSIFARIMSFGKELRKWFSPKMHESTGPDEIMNYFHLFFYMSVPTWLALANHQIPTFFWIWSLMNLTQKEVLLLQTNLSASIRLCENIGSFYAWKQKNSSGRGNVIVPFCRDFTGYHQQICIKGKRSQLLDILGKSVISTLWRVCSLLRLVLELLSD